MGSQDLEQRENREQAEVLIYKYTRSECFQCLEGVECGAMSKFNKEHLIEAEW